MSPTSRFSLWLMPSPEAQEKFQELNKRLSARLGTPSFEPHITLLGGLAGEEPDLRQRLRALAAAVEPFATRLLETGWRDEYHRCLFVEVAASRVLHEARETARRIFEQRVQAEFQPHLSLVYGNLKEDEKQAIAGEIGRYFDESLRIEEVALYDTSAKPEAWRCVGHERLGKPG